MSESRAQTLPQAYLEEHASIDQQIDDLKAFWHQVDELGLGPKYEEMSSRIHEFRDIMEEHFSKEESDRELLGVLHAQVTSDPRFTMMHREHVQLLDRLNAFSERLKQCEDVYHCWQEVRSDFDKFLSELSKHEAEETRILESALKENAASVSK